MQPLIIPSKFTAIDKFSPVMRKMTASTSKFTTKARAGFEMVAIADRKVRMGMKKTMSKLGTYGKMAAGFGGMMLISHMVSANVELDKSLQSLQAITGVTGEAFVPFRKEIENVSKSQRIFAADTAKAFELVGSAKPELLANAEALGAVSEAAIILGKAGKLEVTEAVNSLTISMNQFGVGADKAASFVDILATAQQKGSGTIAFLSEAMVNAGATSRAFGNSFEDTVAILEGFAKAGLPASRSGTALSAILSKLTRTSIKEFNPQFTKATDIIDNLATANLDYTKIVGLVGEENAKYLQSIINQNEIIQKLTGNLDENGNALKQANIQTLSLQTLWSELIDTFDNATTSVDNNNTVMLLTKWLLRFVANNMNIVIGVAITLISTYAILKTILWGVRIAMIATSIIVGISTALQKGSIFALRESVVAQKAYIVMTNLMTAATWLWTHAQTAIDILLTANPIGLIVMAIIAMIAIITILIYKYDEWGAAISLLFPTFAVLLNLIMSIKRHWNNITEAFSKGGIIEGIKAIGLAIIDTILYPLQQMMDLLGFDGISQSMDKMKQYIGIKVDNPVNPDAAIENVRTQREENVTTNKQTAELNVNAPEGFFEEIGDFIGDIAIKLTSTM